MSSNSSGALALYCWLETTWLPMAMPLKELKLFAAQFGLPEKRLDCTYWSPLADPNSIYSFLPLNTCETCKAHRKLHVRFLIAGHTRRSILKCIAKRNEPNGFVLLGCATHLEPHCCVTLSSVFATTRQNRLGRSFAKSKCCIHILLMRQPPAVPSGHYAGHYIHCEHFQNNRPNSRPTTAQRLNAPALRCRPRKHVRANIQLVLVRRCFAPNSTLDCQQII